MPVFGLSLSLSVRPRSHTRRVNTLLYGLVVPGVGPLSLTKRSFSALQPRARLSARLARKSQRAAPPGEAIRALSTYRRVRGLLSEPRRASRSLCRCATKLAHERALADDIMPCKERGRADVSSGRNVVSPSPAAGPSPAVHPPSRFTDLISPLSASLEMWRQP